MVFQFLLLALLLLCFFGWLQWHFCCLNFYVFCNPTIPFSPSRLNAWLIEWLLLFLFCSLKMFSYEILAMETVVYIINVEIDFASSAIIQSCFPLSRLFLDFFCICLCFENIVCPRKINRPMTFVRCD